MPPFFELSQLCFNLLRLRFREFPAADRSGLLISSLNLIVVASARNNFGPAERNSAR
jgi:hypothetical protein